MWEDNFPLRVHIDQGKNIALVCERIRIGKNHSIKGVPFLDNESGHKNCQIKVCFVIFGHFPKKIKENFWTKNP